MVYNSRSSKRRHAVWRRRRCLKCSHNFTTREIVETEGILYVLQDKKRRLPFSHSKLLLSLIKVLDHRSDDAAYWLSETIEEKLLSVGVKKEGLLTKADIIEACLITLKPFDTAAFVKYLSYHSSSLDARTLKRELKRS